MTAKMFFHEACSLTAASLRSEDGVAKKILDFFWLDVKDGKICSKAIGGALFGICNVQDEAYAAAVLVCMFPVVMTFNPKSMCLVQVSNPFFMKSLEEINITLDLLGDDARAS